MSVPDHQLEPPRETYPCPACEGNAAADCVADVFKDMTDAMVFPADSVREFCENFEEQMLDMMDFARDRAAEARKRNDFTWCPTHQPTRDDDA